MAEGGAAPRPLIGGIMSMAIEGRRLNAGWYSGRLESTAERCQTFSALPAEAGANAVLIGEALMRAEDPTREGA